MKSYFQFITTPTADTPGTTLLLHFDDKRYMFGNVSEGTQRACVERGVRFSHLTEIFLTGKTSWANNGGMIGMVLTLADAIANAATSSAENEREKAARFKAANSSSKKESAAPAAADAPKKLRASGYANPGGALPAMKGGEEVDQKGTLTVHGGKNLAHTFATARRFIFRKGMPLYVHEFEGEEDGKDAEGSAKSLDEPTWSDHHIKVWAMSVPPSSATTAASNSSTPKSPRKRSLDEFQERASGSAATASGSESKDPDQHTKDQLLRQAVVSHMFNSDWRMDSLMEVPLAEVMQPAAMFIRSPETNKLEPYTGPKPGDGNPLPDIKVLVRKPWPGALIQDLPPTSPSHEALSYIIRNHDLRGKFDREKAVALNVERGPKYSRLSNGESVESMDGKIITSDMVLGPPRTGRGVAIVDLPTPDYVENLVNRPEWTTPEVVKGLEAFIWILGPGVGSHPALQEFVSKMSQCEHIVSSPDYCPNYLALDSGASASIRLSKLDNERFQVPVHSNAELPQRGLSKLPAEPITHPDGKSPFRMANRGLLVEMEPKFMVNEKEVQPRLNTASVVQTVHAKVAKRAASVREEMRQPEFQKELENLRQSLPGGDAEIVALGTGSSLPSKYRNVSATLLRVPGYGNYLLDCGESTLGQLKRVFGREELREILRDLRMIWISHLHADHHLGTVSVIKAWYEEVHDGIPMAHDPEKDMAKILQEKRLPVVSDRHMINWLAEYASVEDFGYSRLLPLSASSFETRQGNLNSSFHYNHNCIDTSETNDSPEQRKVTTLTFDSDSPYPASHLSPLLRSATGLENLLTVNVSHCQGSKAVSLVFPDGFKFSYSGDCRPSPAFAKIGQNSTVLLHEATFEDEMQGDAIAKKHSTTKEALQIGRMMKAKNVLLTHFSQRYQKLPKVGAFGRSEGEGEGEKGGEGEEDPMPVAVAFDYMRVKVRDIACAQAYTPALMKLFEMEEEGYDEDGSDMVEGEGEVQAQTQAQGKNGAKGNGNGNGKKKKVRRILG